MIETLYTNFQQCTMNLDFTSEWFQPTRGLFRGNPISSTTFIIIVEILGQNIRDNPDIKGITMEDTEFKSVQFADDMNLFSLYQQHSLDSAITTLSQFESSIGLKHNYEKTNVYRIGSLRNSEAMLYTQKI